MLGLNFDPLITCGLVGFIWPLVQAAFDKPYWTAGKRRLIVLVAGILLGIVIWLAGVYPASWRIFCTQAGIVIGAASAAFTILKQAGVIDWVGRVTPGGEPAHEEPYRPKHLAKDDRPGGRV